VTKFCASVDIHDVITCASFFDDRLRGLGVARGRISSFPIDLRRRPYNTLALPCECVVTERRAILPNWEAVGSENPSPTTSTRRLNIVCSAFGLRPRLCSGAAATLFLWLSFTRSLVYIRLQCAVKQSTAVSEELPEEENKS